MTPKQRQFHDILNEASLSCVMREFNVLTGRAYTHKETAEILTRLAKDAPHLMEAEIRNLRKKIDLLRAYLPQKKEPSHD